MANLSLPTETSLPFLKNCLKNNESSYQYLKDILVSKKDREQRQKLILTEKNKEEEYKSLLKGSMTDKAIFSLRLTSSRGFLDQKDLSLSLCCRKLTDINLSVTYRLNVPLGSKWLCLSDKQIADTYGSKT